MDESFYSGLPQVCIKDAIFQPRTSFRHATELMQMFQAKSELVKPLLIITNDGGVDRTIKHERNIIAILALFLHTRKLFCSLISIPVEKINCILNLAWNGISCSSAFLIDSVPEKVGGLFH